MIIPKLNTVLYANAAFCSLSALVALVLPGFLAQYIIDLPIAVFIVLGIGLLVFALDVFLTAGKSAPSRGKILYIFCADVAWVVLTPVMMLLLADRITSLGNLLLIDIAIIVGAFAACEWLGIGKLRINPQE